MADITHLVRRHGLSVLVIIGLGAGVVASWVYQLPPWLGVIGLIMLVFAIIALLGDLGLFGGDETE